MNSMHIMVATDGVIHAVALFQFKDCTGFLSKIVSSPKLGALLKTAYAYKINTALRQVWENNLRGIPLTQRGIPKEAVILK